jgi:hypothetical protein
MAQQAFSYYFANEIDARHVLPREELCVLWI